MLCDWMVCMVWGVVVCDVMLFHGMLSIVALLHVTSCYVLNVMLCYGMLCFPVMLCSVRLCHVMLWSAMHRSVNFRKWRHGNQYSGECSWKGIGSTRVILEFRRASFRVCLERNKLHEDIPGVQEEVPGECSWKGIDSDREGEKRMEGKRKAERARAKGKAEERKER